MEISKNNTNSLPWVFHGRPLLIHSGYKGHHSGRIF